ncbi:MAG: hypothetical protein JXR42_04060 [Gammaproteobacteria bacterium]|nr:hypothetical protein [Gammaproteobacteria bacterium]
MAPKGSGVYSYEDLSSFFLEEFQEFFEESMFDKHMTTLHKLVIPDSEGASRNSGPDSTSNDTSGLSGFIDKGGCFNSGRNGTNYLDPVSIGIIVALVQATMKKDSLLADGRITPIANLLEEWLDKVVSSNVNVNKAVPAEIWAGLLAVSTFASVTKNTELAKKVLGYLWTQDCWFWGSSFHMASLRCTLLCYNAFLGFEHKETLEDNEAKGVTGFKYKDVNRTPIDPCLTLFKESPLWINEVLTRGMIVDSEGLNKRLQDGKVQIPEDLKKNLQEKIIEELERIAKNPVFDDRLSKVLLGTRPVFVAGILFGCDQKELLELIEEVLAAYLNRGFFFLPADTDCREKSNVFSLVKFLVDNYSEPGQFSRLSNICVKALVTEFLKSPDDHLKDSHLRGASTILEYLYKSNKNKKQFKPSFSTALLEEFKELESAEWFSSEKVAIEDINNLLHTVWALLVKFEFTQKKKIIVSILLNIGAIAKDIQGIHDIKIVDDIVFSINGSILFLVNRFKVIRKIILNSSTDIDTTRQLTTKLIGLFDGLSDSGDKVRNKKFVVIKELYETLQFLLNKITELKEFPKDKLKIYLFLIYGCGKMVKFNGEMLQKKVDSLMGYFRNSESTLSDEPRTFLPKRMSHLGTEKSVEFSCFPKSIRSFLGLDGIGSESKGEAMSVYDSHSKYNELTIFTLGSVLQVCDFDEDYYPKLEKLLLSRERKRQSRSRVSSKSCVQTKVSSQLEERKVLESRVTGTGRSSSKKPSREASPGDDPDVSTDTSRRDATHGFFPTKGSTEERVSVSGGVDFWRVYRY